MAPDTNYFSIISPDNEVYVGRCCKPFKANEEGYSDFVSGDGQLEPTQVIIYFDLCLRKFSDECCDKADAEDHDGFLCCDQDSDHSTDVVEKRNEKFEDILRPFSKTTSLDINVSSHDLSLVLRRVSTESPLKSLRINCLLRNELCILSDAPYAFPGLTKLHIDLGCANDAVSLTTPQLTNLLSKLGTCMRSLILALRSVKLDWDTLIDLMGLLSSYKNINIQLKLSSIVLTSPTKPTKSLAGSHVEILVLDPLDRDFEDEVLIKGEGNAIVEGGMPYVSYAHFNEATYDHEENIIYFK